MAIVGKTRAAILQSVPLARQRIVIGVLDLSHAACGRTYGFSSMLDLPSEGAGDQAAHAVRFLSSKPR